MLGTNIKNARKKLKFTQKELANLVGIAEITIRKYEKGEREPNLETIEKLASALRITPYELLSNASETGTSDYKAITEAANNLALLTDTPNEAVKMLADHLEFLIENITANVLNKHDIPTAWHDYSDYVNEMNKLLNILCITVNPVQYINNPQHTEMLKAIDDFIGYKLNQFEYEQED